MRSVAHIGNGAGTATSRDGFTEPILTIPNLLSAYRLLSLPAVFYLMLTQQRLAFAIMIAISLATDILDGLIARVFHQATALGARLDSYADLGTCIAAVTGLAVLDPGFVRGHIPALVVFTVFYAAPQLFAILRFGKLHSMHLYSSKATAYLQGAFFISFFFLGYCAPVFYGVLAFGVAGNLEEIAALSMLREPRSNVRGVYWLLRDASRQFARQHDARKECAT